MSSLGEVYNKHTDIPHFAVFTVICETTACFYRKAFFLSKAKESSSINIGNQNRFRFLRGLNKLANADSTVFGKRANRTTYTFVSLGCATEVNVPSV